MKTIKPILLLCAALCFATACKKEVDMTLVQKTLYENADIRQIEVEDAWQVTIVADSNTYIELEYSAYLEPGLNIKKQGTLLEIGFTDNVNPVVNSVFRATIHLKKIEWIEAEDASRLNFTGHFFATSDTLYVNLDDASVCTGLNYSGAVCEVALEDASHFLDFELSGYNCEVSVSDASTCKGRFDIAFNYVANLSGASQLVTFGGSAYNSTIRLEGGSQLNMVQTEIHALDVDLTGVSEATVNVTERITGSLKEASTLYYMGHPMLDVDCSEDSRIVPF